MYRGFSGGFSSTESACQCRGRKRGRFDPCVGKIPWKRTWQPTPVFLPGESHGQRSRAAYTVHGVAKSRTWLKRLSTAQHSTYEDKEEAVPVIDFFGNGRTWSKCSQFFCGGSMVGHPSCVLSPQLTPPPWGSLWCQNILTSQKALSCFKNSPPQPPPPQQHSTPGFSGPLFLNQGTQLDPPGRDLTPHQLTSPWSRVHKTLPSHPLQAGFVTGRCAQRLCYWRFTVIDMQWGFTTTGSQKLFPWIEKRNQQLFVSVPLKCLKVCEALLRVRQTRELYSSTLPLLRMKTLSAALSQPLAKRGGGTSSCGQ